MRVNIFLGVIIDPSGIVRVETCIQCQLNSYKMDPVISKLMPVCIKDYVVHNICMQCSETLMMALSWTGERFCYKT